MLHPPYPLHIHHVISLTWTSGSFADLAGPLQWDILSPIWGSQSITVLRTKFESPQSWLNYRNGFGTVVDRYRWEGGCIAEHVRRFPAHFYPILPPRKKPL